MEIKEIAERLKRFLPPPEHCVEVTLRPDAWEALVAHVGGESALRDGTALMDMEVGSADPPYEQRVRLVKAEPGYVGAFRTEEEAGVRCEFRGPMGSDPAGRLRRALDAALAKRPASP